MEETLKAILEEQRGWLQQQIEGQNANIIAHHQQILKQQQQYMREQQLLINQQNQQLITPVMAQLGQEKERGDDRPHPASPSSQGGNLASFNPKIKFPPFDGSNPKGWIKNCTRYFGLCRIPDHQKVDLASLYLKGLAEQWFGSYIWGRRDVSWEEFIVDLCARFRDDLGGKVVEDFNRLQQTGTVDEYLTKFEELKSLLLVRNPNMPESYLLESFIGGLKRAIKALVRAFKPLTLDLAIEQARCQEEHVQALKIPPNRTYKPNHITNLLDPYYQHLLLATSYHNHLHPKVHKTLPSPLNFQTKFWPNPPDLFLQLRGLKKWPKVYVICVTNLMRGVTNVVALASNYSWWKCWV